MSVKDSNLTWQLIDFCNNLKKGGLYVVGDVLMGDVQAAGTKAVRLERLWNDFIPIAKVKAFAEVQLAQQSWRQGAQNLMLSAGLGGMKPNTVVLPFPNFARKHDNTLGDSSQHAGDSALGNTLPMTSTSSLDPVIAEKLEELKAIHGQDQIFQREQTSKVSMEDEFMGSIEDAFVLSKNILIARNFEKLDKNRIMAKCRGDFVGGNEEPRLSEDAVDDNSHASFTQDTEPSTSEVAMAVSPNKPKKRRLLSKRVAKNNGNEQYIDIWFTDEIDPEDLRSFSGSLSLMLQLAHGLNRTDIWQECTQIRLVQLLEQTATHPIQEDVKAYHRERLESLLSESRINAKVEIMVMTNDQQLRPCSIANSMTQYQTNSEVSDEQQLQRMKKLNEFIREHTYDSAVLFLNLPRIHDERLSLESHKGASRNSMKFECKNAVHYVEEVSQLTEGLPPTVLAAAGRNQTVITTEI